MQPIGLRLQAAVLRIQSVGGLQAAHRKAQGSNSRVKISGTTQLRKARRGVRTSASASANARPAGRRKASHARAKTAAAARARRTQVTGRTASASRLGSAAGRRKRSSPLLRGPRTRRTVTRPRISSTAYKAGYALGLEDGVRLSLEHEPYQKKALNRHWIERPEAKQWAGMSWRQFNEASKGYVHGFFRAKKQKPMDWVLLPTDKTVAAIISVRNEERTIGPIMHQLNRLPLDEVYVIVNGSADGSFQLVRQRSHAVVLSFPEPLGHDVGRAMGAKLAGADILLFLDGDIVIPAEELTPFVGGIDRGLDVALNNVTPFMHSFVKRDQVTHMKEFLNASLGRSDLEANSMTAVPHALSRKAVTTLGIASLMVPPKAQTLAVHHGLRIAAPGRVNVIRSNKRRSENTGRLNPVADLIIGDHVEALKLAGDLSGERLSFADGMRQRTHAGGEG